MNLHEYQAKRLFSDYGIPVPRGDVARTTQEAVSIAQDLGGSRWILKAQVHAGGRGKAGGIKLVDDINQIDSSAAELLGAKLITHQTGPDGLPIESLLVEQPSSIARELYVGALIDRANEKLVFMASAAGGMDIEAVAAKTPDKILTELVDPVAGLQGFQCRNLAFKLGLAGNQIREFTAILMGLARLFSEQDVSLVEINPLIVTDNGELKALDAKVNLDENALYRHKDLLALRDPNQEEPKERAAAEHGLNYVTLDGNIACMVNGAGLAMATMDLIKLHGGEPANFLDVGGGATAEKVAEAFKLILSDEKVQAILVNIFGGIVRCDLIAEGIIQGVKEVQVSLPVVVRLEGTNVDLGRQLLEESGLNVITGADLTDAATKVVSAAQAKSGGAV